MFSKINDMMLKEQKEDEISTGKSRQIQRMYNRKIIRFDGRVLLMTDWFIEGYLVQFAEISCQLCSMTWSHSVLGTLHG